MDKRHMDYVSAALDNRYRSSRSLETPETDFELLLAARGAVKIDFEKALEIPAFAASLAFICDTVAMLPIRLYREKDGKTELIRDDVRVRLLNDDTGGLLDPYQSKRQMVEDYFRRGAGYMYIAKYKGKPSRLLYVDADNVGYMTNADPIFLDGILQVGGKSYESFEFLKICRRTKNGLTGKSIIEDNNDLLASAYYLIRYGLKSSKNGGKRRGVLQSENKLGDPELKKLKAAWEEMYSSDGDKALILNNGVKFSEISQTAVEQQLAEQKKEIKEEICALFGLNIDVISSKASDDERIAAIKTAIMPILTAFTKSANKELLLESEKYAPEGDMYFEFDLSESMKADMLKRFQAYEIALRSKWLQPDEVRYKEDLDPLGLDFITLGLDDVLYEPKTKTVYTPNTNQTTKLGEGGVKIDEERFNHCHDALGKFCSGGNVFYAPDGMGGGGSGSSSSEKAIDKAEKSGIIEKANNRVDPTGKNEFKVKGFANKQKLNNHWENGRTHKDEFVKDGIITKEQYEITGLKLAESSVGGNIIGHADKYGNVIRYDISKNYFAKGNPEKGLKTFMKPKNGRKYYDEQREEDLKHGGKA